MDRQKAPIQKYRNQFSRLALYVMISGWAGFAVYVFLFFVLDPQEGRSFLSHFLSTEHNGVKFRALVLFTPFITTVIGFLVNEREKFLHRSLSSEQRYSDLFEHANDAIFILGSNTEVVDANRKALDLLGRPREELVGIRLSGIVPQEDSDLLELGGKNERFVCRMLTRDGAWLDMEVTSSPILENDSVTGSRIIARDITDFKCMQDELSRTYDELQNSFMDKSNELMKARKNLLFESYERQKAEDTISELLIQKKFSELPPADLLELSDEDDES